MPQRVSPSGAAAAFFAGASRLTQGAENIFPASSPHSPRRASCVMKSPSGEKRRPTNCHRSQQVWPSISKRTRPANRASPANSASNSGAASAPSAIFESLPEKLPTKLKARPLKRDDHRDHRSRRAIRTGQSPGRQAVRRPVGERSLDRRAANGAPPKMKHQTETSALTAAVDGGHALCRGNRPAIASRCRSARAAAICSS